MVISRDQAVVRTGKDDFGILRRWRNPARLAAAHVEPILARDAAASRAAGDAHGRVVLLSAVNVIRKIVVNRDAIELRSGLVLFAPAPATVERDVRATVVAL